MPKKYYNPQEDVVQIKDGKRTPVQAYDLYQGFHAGPGRKLSEVSESSQKKAPTNEEPLSLRFDGQYLTLVHKEGNKTTEYNYPAVSGKPLAGEKDTFNYDKERQKIKNVGPIPEGEHTVDLNTTTYWKNLDAGNKIASWLSPIAERVGFGKQGGLPGGKIPWGPGRISVDLDPKVAADTGRTGITIHGGFFPGSAGCIDLVNHAQSFFDKVEELKGNQKKIPLTVNYSKTPKKVQWDKDATPKQEEKSEKSEEKKGK